MDWAFRHGMMQFGVFRGHKPPCLDKIG
jgi:hypothetical protein